MRSNKKRFVFLWLACIVGAWSLIPYLMRANMVPQSMALGKLFLICTLQAALVYGILLWLTYRLLPRTDLAAFPKVSFKRAFLPAIVLGILAGLLIFVLEKTLFQNSVLAKIHAPAWTGALASIYGAINEEVLLRLFLFTLLYFLLRKICKTQKRAGLLWSVNILVALLFGLGHLPAAFTIIQPSAFETFRILLLNGIPGVVFGWLYWSRGFYAAAAAHFCTDLMIHVCLV